ncbi:MAG: hypothetical protein R2879_07400 [Saprospiraceae bacterium]
MKRFVGINNRGPIGRLNFFLILVRQQSYFSLNGNEIELNHMKFMIKEVPLSKLPKNTSVIETSNLNRVGTYFVLAKYLNGELGAGIFMLH